jgi:acyl-CoA thioesterase FadM
VYRHSTDVTPDDIESLIAEVDPTAPGYGHHLTFDRILRRCGLAWTTFLAGIEGFGTGVIVPRLEVDYHREVGVGPLDVDVRVLSIGRTSFRIECAVSQDGEPAATVQVVLVSFGYDARTPLALTDAQRLGLAAALDPR